MLRISSMPIDIENSSKRNQPLRRGIHITEHKDYRVNPEPLVLQEADFLLEEFLSPTKLRALTGTDDLSSIQELEMIVDTSDTSLGNFGVYLQKLALLKLSNSIIPRIRDLGTSLSHVRVLWMARCCLTDLDGITSLQSLEELFVAYNEISDLSALSMLEHLRILDLESNLVDDLRQVEFLALCPSLKTLSLEGNPINNHANYRTEIVQRLPRLETLDDVAANRSDKFSSSASSEPALLFQQDWSFIEECIAAGMGPPEEQLVCNQADPRPRSANRSPLNRPASATFYRPRSAARLGSAGGMRPPSASLRPSTDPVKNEYLDNSEDVVSELTIGPAFQGNLTKILRSRKQQQTVATESSTTSTTTERKEQISLSTKSPTNNNISATDNPLMKELSEWKQEHKKKIEERKKLLEPQVLRIGDDDDILENDLEVEESEDENSYGKDFNHFSKEQSTVPSKGVNFGLDESYPSAQQHWKQVETSIYNSEKSESRLTTGDTELNDGFKVNDDQIPNNCYRSNSSTSIHQILSRPSSRASTADNGYSSNDRFRSPLRVNHQPLGTTTNSNRPPLSIPTGAPSNLPKGPSSPTKRSLKDLRNDPLPTLPRLPPRKT